jgi:polyisoprenoid-binding protein YceI
MNEQQQPPSRSFTGTTMLAPGLYEVDPVHSFVLFRVRHLIVGRVDGRLTSFRGKFKVVEEPERLFDRFEVTFDAVSVDTQVEMRDKDLRSARFFDAERFPTISLKGATSRRSASDRWIVNGELTIRDISRPVQLEVTVRGMTRDAHGKAKAALTVVTAIERSDFELTTELREESGEPGTGPDVEISADVETFLRE